MAKKKIDFESLTVSEIVKLNDYQRDRYLTWLEGKKTKKKNSNSLNDNNFSEEFERSCKKYERI